MMSNDKTVVLKEVDVDRYDFELMAFENDCHSIREEGHFVYVKVTPDHMNKNGHEWYRLFGNININMDFKFSQWFVNVIDYLVFVDGDKMRILKNRFDKRQKMVIVA